MQSGGTLGGYGSVTGNVTNSGVIAAGSAAFPDPPVGAFTIIGLQNFLSDRAGSWTGVTATRVDALTVSLF